MDDNEEHSNGSKSTVKEQIFLELGKVKALNMTELHALVTKVRPGISYHAVYKALKNLVRHGVVEKNEDGYSISNKWVERVSAFFETAKRNYVYTKPIYLPGIKGFKESGETRIFIFENLEEAEKYRKQLQWEYLISGSKEPYCAMSGHLRSPLFSSERALNIMSMATKAKSKAFMLVAGDTQVDEWCADYYRNEFVRVQTGIKCTESCDTMILGDTVIQLYLPSDLREMIDAMYASVSEVSNLDVHQFYKKVYKELQDIKLVVIENPEIAHQLRAQIMAHFKFEKVAFFDVNGTLVNGFLAKIFAEYLSFNDKFDKKKLEQMVMLNTADKKGEITHDYLSDKVIRLYAEGLKGRAVEEIRDMARRFVDEGRVPLFRLSKRVFEWVNSYYRTIAITKAPEEIIEALKPIFAFDDIIASHLEVRDGKYTGKIKQTLNTKSEKAEAFEVWMNKTKCSLKGSLGFGNLYNDFSFLEQVEKPMLFGNPDLKSTQLAKKRGWPVFTESSDAHDVTKAINGVKRCRM